ncbi:MAG: tripartite tricarboxylate transporter substrate binding protein, partial [Burkholderiaceae bacterium]|nr:tripartite tricarboxylate transporter substrate binding protein [Burkholderiaceae bacterium]
TGIHISRRFAVSDLTRRNILSSMTRLSLAATVGGLVPGLALAQAYPSRKPITIVLPTPPGSGTDATLRMLAQEAEGLLKQTVNVENRPGASGHIGLQYVLSQPADGYTLALLTSTAVVAYNYLNKPFDMSKTWAAVGSYAEVPIVLVVNPAVVPSINTLAQLFEYAKSRPSTNYTTAGVGSMAHLSMESLRQIVGVTLQHIPYKGSGQALIDVLGGQVGIYFSDLPTAMPHIRSGKLKAIAVAGAKRDSRMPDVPTVAEQGFPGFEAASFLGLAAPAGTAAGVVAMWSEALRTVIARPAIRDKLIDAGLEPNYQPPEVFAKRVQARFDQTGKIIRERGITP